MIQTIWRRLRLGWCLRKWPWEVTTNEMDLEYAPFPVPVDSRRYWREDPIQETSWEDLF